MAVSCSEAGASEVTLLSRTPHWATPRFIANHIPYQHVFKSRLGQALIVGLKGPMPGTSPAWATAWHYVSWPLMAVAFKAVELLFALQFGNVSGPTSPFLKRCIVADFHGYGHLLTYDLRDKVNLM